MKNQITKINEFEALFAKYIAKLSRVDELKEMGRYGYQLRMPHKAVKIAYRNLSEWCEANGESCPV